MRNILSFAIILVTAVACSTTDVQKSSYDIGDLILSKLSNEPALKIDPGTIRFNDSDVLKQDEVLREQISKDYKMSNYSFMQIFKREARNTIVVTKLTDADVRFFYFDDNGRSHVYEIPVKRKAAND